MFWMLIVLLVAVVDLWVVAMCRAAAVGDDLAESARGGRGGEGRC